PEKLLYGMHNTTKRLMENGRWAWHNGLFDIKWFRAMGIKADVHEDTVLLSYTFNENGGYHDLDQVAQHWIRAPKHKGMLDEYLPNKKTSYRVIPPLVLAKYNAIDLSKQHRVLKPMLAELQNHPHLTSLYRTLLIPANDFIAEMQLYGVKVDVDRVKQNYQKLTDELAGLNEQLQVYARKHVGTDINFGSPKQLKDLLYGKLGLGMMSMSTNEAALEDISRKYDHPIVSLLLDYRERIKARGTYVTNLIDFPNPK
ncbi:DNA polymerase, partial [Parvimonas sp. M20]